MMLSARDTPSTFLPETLGYMSLKSLALPGLALLLLLTGCAKKNPPPPPPPEAGYVVLAPQTASIDIELSGRTTAYETSEVRPQVSGLILARRFTEGSIVHQGETLYEIDPSLYGAAAAEAKANVGQAEANRAAAEARASRYKPLVEIEAVSKQDYTDAVAQARQAAAQVAQTRAALKTAEINLAFTRVPAPITGRVGRSLVTTGALVTSGQDSPLTTISRLDPINVDIQQSSADLVALRNRLASGGVLPSGASVQLMLEDGSVYAQRGRVEFAEPLVDPSTGTVTLRARFPNPQNLLLPGMFVRARFSQATLQNVILAPQQAVSRTPRGDASVMLVGPDNKAVLRQIKVDRTIGDKWLVVSGLAAGDKVITEGLSRVRPGQPVHPVLAGSAAAAPAAQAGR
ncbi:efflux RND transporter periplasmic adaptor subunit [Phenylobacterium sp. LjRoot219]|uniref:efflux RND transporter periplasmic adaptor subunit n=1 Tax=Phenylobacterium sp. LjRoot219 TaxID=3342283 RepID=UPI003ECD9588